MPQGLDPLSRPVSTPPVSEQEPKKAKSHKEVRTEKAAQEGIQEGNVTSPSVQKKPRISIGERIKRVLNRFFATVRKLFSFHHKSTLDLSQKEIKTVEDPKVQQVAQETLESAPEEELIDEQESEREVLPTPTPLTERITVEKAPVVSSRVRLWAQPVKALSKPEFKALTSEQKWQAQLDEIAHLVTKTYITGTVGWYTEETDSSKKVKETIKETIANLHRTAHTMMSSHVRGSEGFMEDVSKKVVTTLTDWLKEARNLQTKVPSISSELRVHLEGLDLLEKDKKLHPAVMPFGARIDCYEKLLTEWVEGFSEVEQEVLSHEATCEWKKPSLRILEALSDRGMVADKDLYQPMETWFQGLNEEDAKRFEIPMKFAREKILVPYFKYDALVAEFAFKIEEIEKEIEKAAGNEKGKLIQVKLNMMAFLNAFAEEKVLEIKAFKADCQSFANHYTREDFLFRIEEAIGGVYPPALFTTFSEKMKQLERQWANLYFSKVFEHIASRILPPGELTGPGFTIVCGILKGVVTGLLQWTSSPDFLNTIIAQSLGVALPEEQKEVVGKEDLDAVVVQEEARVEPSSSKKTTDSVIQPTESSQSSNASSLLLKKGALTKEIDDLIKAALAFGGTGSGALWGLKQITSYTPAFISNFITGSLVQRFIEPYLGQTVSLGANRETYAALLRVYRDASWEFHPDSGQWIPRKAGGERSFEIQEKTKEIVTQEAPKIAKKMVESSARGWIGGWTGAPQFAETLTQNLVGAVNNPFNTQNLTYQVVFEGMIRSYFPDLPVTDLATMQKEFEGFLEAQTANSTMISTPV